jgi:hypothetical protein
MLLQILPEVDGVRCVGDPDDCTTAMGPLMLTFLVTACGIAAANWFIIPPDAAVGGEQADTGGGYELVASVQVAAGGASGGGLGEDEDEEIQV